MGMSIPAMPMPRSIDPISLYLSLSSDSSRWSGAKTSSIVDSTNAEVIKTPRQSACRQ